MTAKAEHKPGIPNGFKLSIDDAGNVTDDDNAPRPLWKIAAEIAETWPAVNYAAVPYLDAMHQLDSINDNYGYDTARQIVAYFLGNARTWRGDDARRIKAELKALI